MHLNCFLFHTLFKAFPIICTWLTQFKMKILMLTTIHGCSGPSLHRKNTRVAQTFTFFFLKGKGAERQLRGGKC